eukprot:9025770-Alexandrium_andersonii.AAC.1
MFGQKLQAEDSQLEQLAAVIQTLRSSQATSPEAAPAAGGGKAPVVDLVERSPTEPPQAVPAAGDREATS